MSRTDMLARSPEALATAVTDMEEIGRYMIYAIAGLAFLVWVLLRSR
jgi:hypothetical protein